jgi:hypothetical protein
MSAPGSSLSSPGRPPFRKFHLKRAGGRSLVLNLPACYDSFGLWIAPERRPRDPFQRPTTYDCRWLPGVAPISYGPSSPLRCQSPLRLNHRGTADILINVGGLPPQELWTGESVDTSAYPRPFYWYPFEARDTHVGIDADPAKPRLYYSQGKKERGAETSPGSPCGESISLPKRAFYASRPRSLSA